MEQVVTMSEAVIRYFETGGFFMIPIAIVCIVGCVIISERVLYLASTAIRGKRLWRRVAPLLAERRFDEAAHLAVSANCAMGGMLRHGLDRLHRGRRRNDIDKMMEQSLDRIMPQLERHTHYLVKFANVAILLGLLGTLVGIIGVFATVGSLGAAEQADLFAEGIAGSVTPAAFGMIVAIPMLLIHTFLQTLTADLMDHFELVASDFSATVTQRHCRRDSRTGRPALRLVESVPANVA